MKLNEIIKVKVTLILLYFSEMVEETEKSHQFEQRKQSYNRYYSL